MKPSATYLSYQRNSPENAGKSEEEIYQIAVEALERMKK